MKLFVVGTPEDVVGLALAGVEGIACTTREEAGQAISRAEENTLLIVSARFTREVPREWRAVTLPVRS